jgi:hypothetical protein
VDDLRHGGLALARRDRGQAGPVADAGATRAIQVLDLHDHHLELIAAGVMPQVR